MLGVLSDFEPEKHGVQDDDFREIDRFILSKFQQVKKKILQAYQDYEYHVIYHTISNFFTIELSAFYLNLMKDNLYCNPAESIQRRATQTAIFKMLRESLILMAPIMSFTTEEAWEYLPEFPGKEASIHLLLFPEVEEKYLFMIDVPKWDQITLLREQIFKKIEEARNQKIIGDSLEAEITLELPEESSHLVSQNLDLFKEILVVSKVNAIRSDELKISVQKSKGRKCPRCWNWTDKKPGQKTHPELCSRCHRVIKEMDHEPES
jgi:isoleucyl-tRNA synthetase